jgi:hypothetical protein
MSAIKKTVMAATALTVFTFGATAPSMAATCPTDPGVAGFAKQLKKFCDQEGGIALALCTAGNQLPIAKITKALDEAKKIANSLGISAGNQWIKFGVAESGAMSAKQKPSFTTDKASPNDSLNVTFTRTFGKAGVDAAICAYDGTGKVTKIGEFKVAEGGDRQDDVVKTVNVPSGAKDKIIRVELDGVGSLIRGMKFNLKVQ